MSQSTRLSLSDSHSSEEYNPFYVVIDCQLDEDTNRRDIYYYFHQVVNNLLHSVDEKDSFSVIGQWIGSFVCPC